MITTQGNDDGQLKQYIQRGDPQLKEVLLGFLDSASSLCDMMSTIMAAVLNEIMSIQANEACGAEGATRCGYRERKLKTAVGTLPLMVPKRRCGSYFPTDLFKRCIAH
ncbi:transposase [Atopobium sp. oral taxon 416]|uniref:transposase n=1 Tax=Atopobium sp. oral taxon 416 TaxID=712157 RepID=UPI001BA8304F|nr:transposase [Atopobium sp. oral taxon 416]